MGKMRSQVSAFFFIGLIMVAVLAAAVYFADTPGALRPPQDEDARKKYHTYAQSCTRQALKDALVMSGMQGGAIYNFQAEGARRFLGPGQGYGYGRYVLPYRAGRTLYNVSYLITKPVLGTANHPEVPFYPYGPVKLAEDPKVYGPYINPLGNFPQSPIVPLCDSFGANSRNYSESVSCESYDLNIRADHNSVQEYLESYMESLIKKCMARESRDYVLGNVSVTVTFGETDVDAVASVPLEISVDNDKRKIMLDDVHASLDVRYKKIHELASHVAIHESNNIFFNMVLDASALSDCLGETANSPCKKAGMEVRKLANVCLGTGLCSEGSYDDLFIITDTYSQIDGEAFVFAAAVENRIPALDLIREETGSHNFDIIVPVGAQIVIDPKGFDPDEDQHNRDSYMDAFYHYYGWKQDSDAYFDCPKGGCPVHEKQYTKEVDQAPLAWTSSQLYRDTMRKASYTATPQDMGVHTVRVEVCDEEDLCDSQAVQILVTNSSLATASSIYPGIGGASIEDPLILRSPITGAAVGVANPGYRWSIMKGSAVVWSSTTKEPRVTLPAAYNISNIRDRLSQIIQTGTHSVRVDILRPDGTVAKAGSPDNTIEVSECLPYRSGLAPYPYTTKGMDPFLGNHSCCLGDPSDPNSAGWGTTAGESQVCHRITEYGCREDENFRSLDGTAAGKCGGPGVVCYEKGKSEFSDGTENDIYQRELTRRCSDRGNTCEGAVHDTRVRVLECGPCETCVYSAGDLPGCAPANTTKPCNLQRKCTDGSDYGRTGKLLCQAGCRAGECSLPVNCVCSADCGAECSPQTGFLWQGYSCSYGCSECMFTAEDETVCASVRLGTCTQQEFEGKAYELCEEGGDVVRNGSYASFCRQQGYCYVSSCSENGAESIRTERCLVAGEIEGSFCYYSPDGQTGCSGGKCREISQWPDSCSAGSPEHGYCLSGSTCHYGIECDRYSGWGYRSAQMQCASGTPQCTPGGVRCS